MHAFQHSEDVILCGAWECRHDCITFTLSKLYIKLEAPIVTCKGGVITDDILSSA